MKKEKQLPICERGKGRHGATVCSVYVPNKIMERILLKTMLRSMENKEEMDDS